jgi:DedD protein
MASRQKKNGGDFILESRHLVGLFLLLVVIFGVVFTLGYLMGRSQYDSRVRAAVGPPPGSDIPAAPASASSAAKPKTAAQSNDAQVPKKGSDWDFYHSADPQAASDHLQPVPKAVTPSAPVPAAPKPVAVPPKTAKPVKPSGDTSGPLIPKGTIMLQVAAVLHQEDALALAQALQQKKFPSFVLTPGADKLYRVQVGPYPDNQSAAAARQQLEAKGFKSIIKR